MDDAWFMPGGSLLMPGGF